MLPYFKKYTIAVCVIAVALPVIVSTIWPLFTGQMMASSLAGLLLMFALFFVGMMIGFSIFNRKAESATARLLALYNDECYPQALIDEGQSLADAITFPCNESGAWFMSYYAQALLESGDVERASGIAKGIRQSIIVSKKDATKCMILVNLIPLEEKLSSNDDVMSLIDEGLGYCKDSVLPNMAVRRQYLENQKKVIESRLADDPATRAEIDKSVVDATDNPMRVRVEFAYDAAIAYFCAHDTEQERTSLEFVAKHGNHLALVSQAKKRLDEMRMSN